MKSSTSSVAFLALAGIVACVARPGYGQVPFGGGYQPSQPIFSPWLNLYQRNTGALDNYHTYVRPEMQLQEAMQQQGALLQRQDSRLNLFENQIGDLEMSSGMHPTGTGSVFMSFSHFYPQTESRSSRNYARPSAPRRPGPGTH